jgi:hypothetical protein
VLYYVYCVNILYTIIIESYIYKTYIYIYRHTHTHERANNLSRTSWVEFIQAELASFVRADPSLYEYVSLNIRRDYCVHEWLIYFSNRYWIELKRAESNRVREESSSSNTPKHERATKHFIHLFIFTKLNFQIFDSISNDCVLCSKLGFS